MKKSVWKYPILRPETHFTIEMPSGAEILSIQVQNNIPCIWALVNTETVMIDNKRFLLVGTGHDIDVVDELKFIGTFQLDKLVFHLFEKL